jgi:hypothetical protein
MWQHIAEPEQDSPNATCRKLKRFLHASGAGKPSD